MMDSDFLYLVEAELASAREKHPGPIHSPHEAYGVIAEEFNKEFFDEACRPQIHKAAMLRELVQVAAMCYRAAEDLGLLEAAEIGPDAHLNYIKIDTESPPLTGIFNVLK